MCKKYRPIFFVAAICWSGCASNADMEVLLRRQKSSQDSIEALGKTIEASRKEADAKRELLNREMARKIESLRNSMATGKQVAELRQGLREDLKKDTRAMIQEELKKQVSQIKEGIVKSSPPSGPVLPGKALATPPPPPAAKVPEKPKEETRGMGFPSSPWPPLIKEAKQWSRKIDEEYGRLDKKAREARKKAQETLVEFQMLIAGLVQQRGQYQKQAKIEEEKFKESWKKLDVLYSDTELLEKMNHLSVILIRLWQEDQRDKELWGSLAFPRSVFRMNQLFVWYQWQLNPTGPEPQEPHVPIPPRIPRERSESSCKKLFISG